MVLTACIRGVEERKPYVIFTSVLEGEYSRKNFAIFLENIYEDMGKFSSYPKTRDIWQGQDE